MGIYKYVRDLWKKPKENMNSLYKERLIAWRKEPSTLKIERPTRIDRARNLGYKAKQGFIVVRQRVPRGGHKRPKLKGGRRPKRYTMRLNLRKSYQVVAEERVQKQYQNLLVLNSYWVAQDGKNIWHEVVLIDPNHPVIRNDPSLNWVTKKSNQSRVFHGKTSAGRKSRGMAKKGKGYEKARPSRRANSRKQ